MSAAAIALLVSTCGYAGFQWTIRVVVYPQFASVGTQRFAAFEARHQRLVGVAVGPLFAAEVITVLLALLTRPAAAAWCAAAGVLGVLAVTAFAAVPQHRRLSAGFDPGTHRRLLRIDSVRLALAVLTVAGAVWYAA